MGRKILVKASVNFFDKKFLNSDCVLVISADTPYFQLPQEIKDQVTEVGYYNLRPNEYMIFNCSKAQVIIVQSDK